MCLRTFRQSWCAKASVKGPTLCPPLGKKSTKQFGPVSFNFLHIHNFNLCSTKIMESFVTRWWKQKSAFLQMKKIPKRIESFVNINCATLILRTCCKSSELWIFLWRCYTHPKVQHQTHSFLSWNPMNFWSSHRLDLLVARYFPARYGRQNSLNMLKTKGLLDKGWKKPTQVCRYVGVCLVVGRRDTTHMFHGLAILSFAIKFRAWWRGGGCKEKYFNFISHTMLWFAPCPWQRSVHSPPIFCL